MGGTGVITRVLVSGQGRQKREKQRDVSMRTHPDMAAFEGGGRGREPRNVGGTEGGSGQKQSLPQRSLAEASVPGL